ncbi:MAG: substrate-binding domain-containing protein [Chloroflexi bacterium]|nr:substrate-binding domain-containing protein [Chloroflexota bacterium]MYD15964.1 substrate-binding domain-containing protein [Chloroflexota bacterium]MYJ00935.1 substrate-binding domain-containing protein [Chloroflexota bacterium]
MGRFGTVGHGSRLRGQVERPAIPTVGRRVMIAQWFARVSGTGSRRLCVTLALISAALIASACYEAARERLVLDDAAPMSVAIIVHGASGDPFWEEVRAGAEDAARTFDVNLFWRSTPDGSERVRLIDEVVQQGFDVIVVSLSDPDPVAEVVSDALLIGVTVYVINAGDAIGSELGVDSYFGQVETVAGLAVGDRLTEVGATHLLCVKHEERNVALDTRCSRAGQRVGALTELYVDPEGPVGEQVEAAIRADSTIDAVLTMNTLLMSEATDAIDRIRETDTRSIVHAVFELNDLVLDAIENGTVLFAVDQQPYLQGYLPVAYSRLTQYSHRTQGDELADALLQWIAGRGVLLGPGFVDQGNVDRVRSATQRSQTPSGTDEQSTEETE